MTKAELEDIWIARLTIERHAPKGPSTTRTLKALNDLLRKYGTKFGWKVPR